MIAMSQEGHGWNIKESIDDGIAGSDEGIRYGYFVDKGHTHPVRIEVEGNSHCTIDQSTPAAVIGQTWKKGYYKVKEILSLVGSLPVISNENPNDGDL